MEKYWSQKENFMERKTKSSRMLQHNHIQASQFFQHHNFVVHHTIAVFWEYKIVHETYRNNKVLAYQRYRIGGLVDLCASSGSNCRRRQQGYLHIVMNTLQKQLAIICQNFPLLGGPQGADQCFKNVCTAIIIEEYTELDLQTIIAQ